jgi:hypothetical protein
MQEFNDLLKENEDLKAEIAKLKQEKNRKYFPTMGEIVDRLVISQLKQFLIKDHRKEYTNEINDILNDIDIEIKKINVDADFIRDVIILAIINREIWLNESNCRQGIKEGNDLMKSHGLNSIRNKAKNRIQERIGGRKDYKLDNVEAYPEWIPSGYE